MGSEDDLSKTSDGEPVTVVLINIFLVYEFIYDL